MNIHEHRIACSSSTPPPYHEFRHLTIHPPTLHHSTIHPPPPTIHQPPSQTEPIFSSDDIMRQMPLEGKLFKSVDLTWRDSMAETAEEPGCLTVARRPGLLDTLIDANAKLDTIQKG